MLELVDALDGFPAQNLGGRLIHQKITPLDRVVSVVLPRIVFEVRERRGDPSLRSPGVRASRIKLAHNRRADAAARFEGRHQPRPTCSDDHTVKTMVVIHD